MYSAMSESCYFTGIKVLRVFFRTEAAALKYRHVHPVPGKLNRGRDSGRARTDDAHRSINGKRAFPLC